MSPVNQGVFCCKRPAPKVTKRLKPHSTPRSRALPGHAGLQNSKLQTKLCSHTGWWSQGSRHGREGVR